MAKQIHVNFPLLKAEMAKRGISTHDLAKVLETSDDSVRRRLKGTVEFELSEIIKIMEYFKCTFEDIFGTEVA